MCFKFGTEIDDGPILRPDDKMTPKWAQATWPGSRDQISKFWDPSYNFGKNRDISFKFGMGHVTKFRNFGTPLITLERIETSPSNLA